MESAFLCGLPHAIGKPVVLRTTATIVRERRIPADKPALQILIEGYHSRVGFLIGEKWGLPKQVIEAIQYSSHYDHATAFRQECILTCGGGWICHKGLFPLHLRSPLSTVPFYAFQSPQTTRQ